MCEDLQGQPNITHLLVGHSRCWTFFLKTWDAQNTFQGSILGLLVCADQRGEDAGSGEQAGVVVGEPGAGSWQGDDRFSLAAKAGGGDAGWEGEAGQDVVEEVQGYGGGQLPAQLVQDQQLPVLKQTLQLDREYIIKILKKYRKIYSLTWILNFEVYLL